MRWIQPGIESLNDNALRAIAKGNSAMVNLQLLKWSSEFGIHVSWSMLTGMPGESDSWNTEMARWLPLVFHLEPPSGVTRIRYDRFSPYQMRPVDFGLTLRPSRAYEYVYPLPQELLMRLAYSFEDRADHGHVHRGIHDQPGRQEIQDLVRVWNDLWHRQRPVLSVRDDGTQLHFFDTRPCAHQRNWATGGLAADVYRLCDSGQTKAALFAQLSQAGREVSIQEFENAVGALCEAKVLLGLNGKLLSLGVNEISRE